MDIDSKDLGTLAIYALRYCIDRRTSAPSDVIEIVCWYWDSISDDDKAIIKRDLDAAFKDVGNNSTIKTWQCFKKLIDDGELPIRDRTNVKWALAFALVHPPQPKKEQKTFRGLAKNVRYR